MTSTLKRRPPQAFHFAFGKKKRKKKQANKNKNGYKSAFFRFDRKKKKKTDAAGISLPPRAMIYDSCYHLTRWYTGRFATTMFSATQRLALLRHFYNVVPTLFPSRVYYMRQHRFCPSTHEQDQKELKLTRSHVRMHSLIKIENKVHPNYVWQPI